MMTNDDLEQLITQYGKDIYSFCIHLTQNTDMADDLYNVGDGSSGMINVSGYKTGVPTYSHASSDGTTEGTTFAVITINDDHTVTMETYALK